MGKIKDLRKKLADGTATDEEKQELETLEEEAKEPVDGAEDDGAGDDAGAGDGAGDDLDSEDAKALAGMGKKLADIALAEFRKGLGKDAKKGQLGGDAKDDKGELPKGKERVKQFFMALFANDHTKLDHLSGGVNADGGFLVPAEFADDFIIARQNETVMRRAGATVVQITGNTFNLPNLATRPKAYWANELAVKSSTSASWGNISLTPYTLAAIMTASNQVIADAKIGGNLIDVITRLMTEAISFAEDTAFFMGSGSGQPTGLNTYTPARSVDALGVLNADKLVQAVYALRQPYRSKASWVMNSRTLAAVRTLKDTQNRPIFENAYGETGFPTLLGRPVYEQDDLPSNRIWFGDFSGYWIADREGVAVAISQEASVGGVSSFERNFTAIRVEERVDGELGDTAAFTVITNVPVS